MSPIAFGGDWDDDYSYRCAQFYPALEPPVPTPVRSAVEIDWNGARAGGILARLNPAVETERRARERKALCPSWMAL